jgi:hypothetical protein
MADNFRQCQGYSGGFALCTLPDADAAGWSRHRFGIAGRLLSSERGFMLILK